MMKFSKINFGAFTTNRLNSYVGHKYPHALSTIQMRFLNFYVRTEKKHWGPLWIIWKYFIGWTMQDTKSPDRSGILWYGRNISAVLSFISRPYLSTLSKITYKIHQFLKFTVGAPHNLTYTWKWIFLFTPHHCLDIPKAILGKHKLSFWPAWSNATERLYIRSTSPYKAFWIMNDATYAYSLETFWCRCRAS